MVWNMPGQGFWMQMLPARLAARRDHVADVVVDDGVDARHPRPGAARFHGLDGRHGAAQEAAVLGLPPGVHDGRLALADDVVIPAPDFGLDGLAHRGHVLEVVIVLGGLVRAELAQGADGGGRGVEDVHVQILGDLPGAAGVREGGHALVDHRRGAKRQRPVDDVGMAGDPADIGHAPVNVLGMDVLHDIWRCRRHRPDSRRCCAGSPWACPWCRWCTSRRAAPRPASFRARPAPRKNP